MGAKKTTTKFSDKVLLVLDQKRNYSNSKNQPVLNPYLVRNIIIIERNKHGQVYEVKNLQSSLHMSVTLDVAKEISFRIRMFFEQDGKCDKYIPTIHVRSSQTEFHCKQSGVFVRNASSPLENISDTNERDHDLSQIHKCISSSIKEGLFHNMKAPTHLATGVDRPSSINGGYSVTNCHEYPNNRKTDNMNVRPFLINKHLSTLNKACKIAILQAIDFGLKICPDKHKTFSFDPSNESRQELIDNLNMELGAEYDEKGKPIGAWISCEAFTIIIPFVLAAHRDLLNDGSIGMNSVLQINISIKYKEEMFGDYSMDKYVKEHLIDSEGYIPVSYIAYSRETNCITTEQDVKMKLWTEKNDDGLGPIRKLVSQSIYDVHSARSKPVTLEQNALINKNSVANAVETYSQRQKQLASAITEDVTQPGSKIYDHTFLQLIGKKSNSLYWEVRDSILFDCQLLVEHMTISEKLDLRNATTNYDNIKILKGSVRVWPTEIIRNEFFTDQENKETSGKPLSLLRKFSTMHVMKYYDQIGVVNRMKQAYSDKDLISKIQSLKWRNIAIAQDCQRKEILIHDPSITFQGPSIIINAAWDKTRYFASGKDAMYSLVTNCYTKKKVAFTKKDGLGFVLYSTITSNGMDSICEIVRMLVESESYDSIADVRQGGETAFDIGANSPSKLFYAMRERSGTSLYSIFAFFGSKYFDKGLGSCRVKRHIICSKGMEFDFSANCQQLETILTNHSEMGVETKMILRFEALKLSLEKVAGFGPVLAHNFIQMSCLVGLLPLKYYNCASLEGSQATNNSRGPNKIISLCLKGTEHNPNQQICSSSKKKSDINGATCELIFSRLHKELNVIWNDTITRSYLENTLCELWRIVTSIGPSKEKVATASNGNRALSDFYEKNIKGVKANIPESRIKEAIFLHRNRCKGRQTQALFRVVNNNGKLWIQMFNHIFQTNGEKTHFVERTWLTDWKPGDNADNSSSEIFWNQKGILIISDHVQKAFLSRTNTCKLAGCVMCLDPVNHNNMAPTNTSSIAKVVESEVGEFPKSMYTNITDNKLKKQETRPITKIPKNRMKEISEWEIRYHNNVLNSNQADPRDNNSQRKRPRDEDSPSGLSTQLTSAQISQVYDESQFGITAGFRKTARERKHSRRLEQQSNNDGTINLADVLNADIPLESHDPDIQRMHAFGS